MTFLRRALLAPVVLGLLAVPVSPATAATAPPSTQAVVNLSFDLSVTLFATELLVDGDYGPVSFSTATYSRPTTAPMPKGGLLRSLGMTLSPGTTTVVSVYSRTYVNDTVCITATSTKTPTVLYLSLVHPRPTTVRPYGCAKPGGKPILTPPSKKVLSTQQLAQLESDLKTVSIAEQSYFADNDSFVADAGISSSSTVRDLLVAQGAKVSVGNVITVSLFTSATPNDSYCETGTNLKTHRVLYLSSLDDTPTPHRPQGCNAP